MNSTGTVEAIFLHREEAGPMEAVASAWAEPGHGLEGDTYYADAAGGNPRHGADREVTLIEAEAVESVPRDHGIPLTQAESRRNLVTRGVQLNPLVGREFRVGEVLLRGIRFCDPCAHLQKLTRPGVLSALAEKGGLRAQILEGGTIRAGDAVVVP